MSRGIRILQMVTKHHENTYREEIPNNDKILQILIPEEVTIPNNDNNTVAISPNEEELLNNNCHIGDMTFESNLYDIENMEIFLEECPLVSRKEKCENPRNNYVEEHTIGKDTPQTPQLSKNTNDATVYPTLDIRSINRLKETEFSDNNNDEQEKSGDDPPYEPISSGTESERSMMIEGDDRQTSNTSNENKENAENSRPRRGRKRKFASQDRHTRKILKNSNKDHINSRGCKIVAKQFLDYKCNSCLNNKCHEKISVEEREREFQKFWEIADYTAQNAYITACVQEKEVKRRYKLASESKRNFSRIYTIKKQIVCRNMFLMTYGLTTKRINTALVKMRSSSFIDNRGKHSNRKKLIPDTIESVINHIRSFPKYKSHYCRESMTGNRHYLSSQLNLVKLYELYQASFPNNNVSFSKYKRIFYDKFNLHFKRLKKDTCNFCDTRNAKLQNETTEERRNELQKELDDHQDLANKARTQMKNDMREAENIDSIETLTFDLEKTLPLPRIPTNIVFYKRQLWVYNLGIHSSKEKKGNCMIWVEGEAGRGAQEVGSCLRKYIFANIGPGVEELRLWSDSCGGQNRNIKLVLMLHTILQNHCSLKKISLNFLISGHSFLPNDADFSDIEKALKNQQRIYTPEEYINVMESCRKRNKLRVYRLENSDFMGTKNLEKNITNRKVDMSGNKINWLKMKEICLQKDQPNLLYTRELYDRNSQPNIVDISKRGRANLRAANLIPLWPQGKPISEAKINDLKALFSLIPDDVKEFYTKLVPDKNIDDDYLEGFDDSLDFDMEES